MTARRDGAQPGSVWRKIGSIAAMQGKRISRRIDIFT
jgi:hypothetical protein